jgi:hypothetical protein
VRQGQRSRPCDADRPVRLKALVSRRDLAVSQCRTNPRPAILSDRTVEASDAGAPVLRVDLAYPRRFRLWVHPPSPRPVGISSSFFSAGRETSSITPLYSIHRHPGTTAVLRFVSLRRSRTRGAIPGRSPHRIFTLVRFLLARLLFSFSARLCFFRRTASTERRPRGTRSRMPDGRGTPSRTCPSTGRACTRRARRTFRRRSVRNGTRPRRHSG